MPLGRIPEIITKIEGVSVAMVNGYACAALTYNGETKTLAEWARRLGFDWHVIPSRLKLGWSIERAFTTPKRKHGKKE